MELDELISALQELRRRRHGLPTQVVIQADSANENAGGLVRGVRLKDVGPRGRVPTGARVVIDADDYGSGYLASQFSADEIEALIQTAGEAWQYAWYHDMREVTSQKQAELAERAWGFMQNA